MKRSILNIALIAFITLGAVSCKDNKETSETEVNDAAEATDKATEFTADVTKSSIKWAGSKPTGNHNGSINLASGTVSVLNNSIQAGNFTIDMSSIISEDQEGESKMKLENHLKGTVEGKEGDFFNVNQYPLASFEITSVSENKGKSLVKGNLTIKDKTNAIEFPATVKVSENEVYLTSDSFVIDRTKWGVNFGSKSIFDNLGDKFISDEVELAVMLYATK